MDSLSDPLHTLNTLPSAQAAELAASTPAEVSTAFGAHRRMFPDPGLDVHALTRPFLFRDLPCRADAGVDERWDKASHRAQLFYRRWSLDRAHRRRFGRDSRALRYQHPRKVSSAVFVKGPVNGALRGLVLALLLEAIGVLAIAAIVFARKLY